VSAGAAIGLDQLVSQLQAELRRDGRYHTDCVFCGKPAKKGQKHFSFCEEGYTCWVCDAKGGLQKLAQHIGAGGVVERPARRAERPQEPRQWQQRPDYYLGRYTGALDRVTRWTSYKPLSLDSIIRWKLGVGVLPSSRCDKRRLILPVFDNGRIAAFHGRAYLADDTDAKWLSCGGSSKQVLFNSDLLRTGATVIVVENFIDAILAMQAAPDVVAVAGGGASWQPEWTAQIAASRPKQVLCWLDNDLVGCPNPETYQRLLIEWRAAHPQATHTPEPNGPKIANALLEVGVKASVYQWPKGTPAKADIGSALMGVV
jgi:hypothetical protein